MVILALGNLIHTLSVVLTDTTTNIGHKALKKNKEIWQLDTCPGFQLEMDPGMDVRVCVCGGGGGGGVDLCLGKAGGKAHGQHIHCGVSRVDERFYLFSH